MNDNRKRRRIEFLINAAIDIAGNAEAQRDKENNIHGFMEVHSARIKLEMIKNEINSVMSVKQDPFDVLDMMFYGSEQSEIQAEVSLNPGQP